MIYSIKKINDSVRINDDIVKELIDDEKLAVEHYKKAIQESNNIKHVELFNHILAEELEHLEELEALLKD